MKMKKIDEVEVNGERIYLRKTFFGWGVIHPVKIDGKINLKNLIAGGSWIKLGIVVLFVCILVGAIVEVSDIVKTANECLIATPIIIPF